MLTLSREVDECMPLEPGFSTSLVIDPLRATVVCTNSHVMVKALEAGAYTRSHFRST